MANSTWGYQERGREGMHELDQGPAYTKRGSAFFIMQDWASWAKLVPSEFTTSPNLVMDAIIRGKGAMMLV